MIKFISHRGNLYGPNLEKENSLDYIQEAILAGFDVEIDVWHLDGEFYLGHDEPQYKLQRQFLTENKDFLWVHAKNINALSELHCLPVNCFFHQNDDVVLTSLRYLWTYPGKELTGNSIAVLPELTKQSINDLRVGCGICSDYIVRYKQEYK